jgi:hypothetical protein
MTVLPDNDPREMDSRTRPGNRPPNDIAALRALRNATRDYIVVCHAGIEALSEEAVARRPRLGMLKTSLAVATGRRGSGFGIGTPIGLEEMLARLLGEADDRA